MPGSLMQHYDAAGGSSAGVDPPRPISVTYPGQDIRHRLYCSQSGISRLAAVMPLLESERSGNWKIRPAAGSISSGNVCVVDESRRISMWSVTGSRRDREDELNDPD